MLPLLLAALGGPIRMVDAECPLVLGWVCSNTELSHEAWNNAIERTSIKISISYEI